MSAHLRLFVTLLFYTLFANWIQPAVSIAETVKPNVLFIAVDDLRPELNCYGHSWIKSPNIDKLAERSIVFNRAYCQIPTCGASRANLMTGILPMPKRFINYLTEIDKDVPGVKTMPQVFKEAGYTTLSNGKIMHKPADAGKRSWSEPAWRSKLGGTKTTYDPETTRRLSKKKKRGRIFEAPDVKDSKYPDGDTALKTIQDLQRLKAAGKPFFLGCGFIKPHMPFYAPKKYWDLYDRKAIKLAENRYFPKDAPADLRGSGEFKSYHLADFEIGSDEFHAMMRHGYYACVSYIDQQVGLILEELKRLELDQNTIIVFWGDHGWHLGEHDFWGKHNTMHLSARIPLIVHLPESMGGASGKSEAMIETCDIFPTLCELAGLKAPKSIHGESFSASLKDPKAKHREFIYCRIRKGDTVINDRFSYTSYGQSEMLFDHSKDPQENQNVARNPEYQKQLKIMKGLLARRMAAAKVINID